jgi:hypothetical protein
MFDVKATGTAELKKLIKEYEKRSEFVRESIVRAMAEDMLENIKRSLPSSLGSEVKEYVSSLEICEYRTNPNQRKSIVSIRSNPKKVKLSEKPEDKTAVYVAPKAESNGRVSAVTMFLFKNGPWTKDTLPMKPPADARVFYMVASKEEIGHLRERIRVNEPSWRPLLSRMGVKMSKPSDVDNIEALPSVAMVGLRLEFGLAGYPFKPHWRPAIRKLQQNLKKLFDKNKDRRRSLTDSKFKGWNKTFTKLPVIDLSDRAMYSDFAKKVVSQQ